MATPENRIKAKIKAVLSKYADDVYYDMPVPSGYGKATVDFVGSAKAHSDGYGRAFAIEAKAPGGVPTARQETTLERMGRGGIERFVIDGDVGCDTLDRWLGAIIGKQT